jgi:hypothetical protein
VSERAKGESGGRGVAEVAGVFAAVEVAGRKNTRSGGQRSFKVAVPAEPW